jgi:protein SCO1
MAVHSKFLSFALICIIGVAGAAAWLLGRHPAPAVELSTGTLLAPSRKLPDFSLIDQHGREFGAANLRGRWTLLFFGYTNCPDFCPATLTTLAALQKRLRADPGAVLPQVVFVSVDAKRDTPAHLAAYVPNFAPEFIGVTAADQSSVEEFAGKLGVSVSIEPTANGDYIVNHTALIFVLDPEARLAAILTGPFAVEPLAGDLRRIVAARGPAAGRT